MTDLLLKNIELEKVEIKDIKLMLNGLESCEFSVRDNIEIFPKYTGKECSVEVNIFDENGNKFSVEQGDMVRFCSKGNPTLE
jgi:hypothetical protein